MVLLAAAEARPVQVAENAELVTAKAAPGAITAIRPDGINAAAMRNEKQSSNCTGRESTIRTDSTTPDAGPAGNGLVHGRSA